VRIVIDRMNKKMENVIMVLGLRLQRKESILVTLQLEIDRQRLSIDLRLICKRMNYIFNFY